MRSQHVAEDQTLQQSMIWQTCGLVRACTQGGGTSSAPGRVNKPLQRVSLSKEELKRAVRGRREPIRLHKHAAHTGLAVCGAKVISQNTGLCQRQWANKRSWKTGWAQVEEREETLQGGAGREWLVDLNRPPWYIPIRLLMHYKHV